MFFTSSAKITTISLKISSLKKGHLKKEIVQTNILINVVEKIRRQKKHQKSSTNSSLFGSLISWYGLHKFFKCCQTSWWCPDSYDREIIFGSFEIFCSLFSRYFWPLTILQKGLSSTPETDPPSKSTWEYIKPVYKFPLWFNIRYYRR